jgi:5-(carboxyamino)imidazole ribonucleotide synthase
MVGGGQLARMTHQAAIGLGQSLLVMAASEGEAAAQVSPNTVIGQHTDLQALRSFAKRASVLTFDHEHVPAEHLRTLAAEGVAVRPGPEALRYAQDKWAMRTRLAELGMPMPAFAGVTSVADVLAFAGEHDWPCVLKAARGGYDGRGVWVLDSEAEARELVPELLAAGTPLIVETHVEMRRELAALVARSPFGQAAAWPVVETVQRHGINVEVLAPAPALDEDLAVRAQRLAIRVAEALGVTGLLAVELFDTRDGVLVNELAMRPHNSGHWSIEGARTSQFEQHLRAVLDYPLGSTELTAPHIVSANVLGASEPELSVDERMHHLFARFPAAKVHYYGKAERPGRKLGHVTTLGADLEGLRRDARLAADYLAAGRWSDGFSAHGTGGTR